MHKAIVLFLPSGRKSLLLSARRCAMTRLPALLDGGQALVRAGKFHKVVVDLIYSDLLVYTQVYSTITVLRYQE